MTRRSVDIQHRAVLTVAEAAALCGVSIETILRAINAGLPTCVMQTGGVTRISRRALDDWFAAGGAVQRSIDAHPASGGGAA